MLESHFNKSAGLKAWRPATLLIRDSDVTVFLGNLRNFCRATTYFEEHLRTTASENWIHNAKLFFSIKIPILKTLNIQICSGSNKFGRNIQIPREKYFSRNLGSSYRSSHWQVFFKICILRNFVIFTGKHLCWSPFLIKPY